MSRNLELFGNKTPTEITTLEVTFTCIGKQVTMSVQQLIDYYINNECIKVAEECGF